MGFYDCERCSARVEYTDGQEPSRNTCFRCHIKTVSIGFTYGKDNFHGPTIKERHDRQMADASAAGVSLESVGSRWV